MKLQVSITYTWEFSARDWDRNNKYFDSIKDEAKIRLNYNPVDMFYHLNNLNHPTATFKIKEID